MSGTLSASLAQESAPVDLHAWITQQVDRAEAETNAAVIGRTITCVPDDGSRPITGTVTEVAHDGGRLSLTAAQYGVQPVDTTPASVQSAAAALRRCEADRRILARHRLDPEATNTGRATACEGCGNEWVQDYCDPNVENLNDCPELLDLAHAHGITDEILTGLDRPQPPEPTMRITNTLSLADVLRIATPPITTSDVPEALRGPRWKPHH